MLEYMRSSRWRTNFSETKFAIANFKGRDMPLVFAPTGQEMKIVKIVADDKTKKHLADIGVIAQAKITVLSSSGGSAVCMVKDARLALDRQLAAHIFVA